MINKNNKKCIVYAFDVLEQIDMFIFSLKSFSKNVKNLENDFLLITSEKIYNEKYDEIITKVKNINSLINIEIKSIKPLNEEKEGMFYWFFASFLTNHKEYLFLDNDTIVKGDISEVWSLNNNYISGVKTTYKWNEENKKIINLLSKNKTYINTRTYINTGVVLMNGDLIRKIGEQKIREQIKDFYSKIKENKLKISDQEFLFSYFGDHVGNIDKRWNFRLSDRFSLGKLLKKDLPIIFHYNIFIDSDNGNYYRKFNYKILISNNKTFKEKEDYLFECYKRTNFYIPLFNNKKYIKNIVNLFEEENDK